MLVKVCSWAPTPWMLPESELSAEGQGETCKEEFYPETAPFGVFDEGQKTIAGIISQE